MSTKNKGGRPPRAKGEKLQRINLTLRPSVMFGLEIIARDRRTSLSQAAEFAIASMIRSYEVQWGDKSEPLAEIVDDLSRKEDNSKFYTSLGERSEEQHKASELLTQLMAIPPHLLTKEEQFIFNCLHEARFEKKREKTSKGDLVTALIHLDDAMRIIDAAREGFALGKSVDEVVEPLRPFQKPPK